MTKFNKEIFSLLVAARAKGHSIAECAHLGGVHRITLQRWISLGRQGDQPFQAFYRRFEKGKAQAAGELLDTLHSQALNGCRASAFFLLDRVHGYSKNPLPPVQINIEAADTDVGAILEEYQTGIRPLLEGPVIDLDED